MDENQFAEMSEVDIAYRLLTESGKENPIYFKTLIRTIINLKNKAVQNEAAAISEIYTMINMDSRFQHNQVPEQKIFRRPKLFCRRIFYAIRS